MTNSGTFSIFLGFLTGALWLYLAVSGILTSFLALLGLAGVLVTIINVLVALVGFLAFLVFGYYVFKRAWHSARS
ncbi:ABC transporter [Bacillus tuaregi]|uniref:ABC transporter n=1 Tax=Bacillus tuaregi TaxID=1816695 RepID=UPI0008F96598|nr:ABC transporter [Bacillus tuaregi]